MTFGLIGIRLVSKVLPVAKWLVKLQWHGSAVYVVEGRDFKMIFPSVKRRLFI